MTRSAKTRPSTVVHLNVVDFQAAVAIAGDRTLADRPFVIAGADRAARAVVLGLSGRARDEGLAAGMPLAAAQRRVRDLLVLAPDPVSCARAEEGMVSIAARYAPLVQDDSGGHLFLDLAGTERLFGAAVDCAVRIRNEISDSLGIEATAAVARNKLVAKVAARSVRPVGIACVRAGDEAGFLSPQDAFLLPGVGPAISRVLSVAGIYQIGELAALSDAEALALFGARGRALRDAALGLDATTVAPGGLGERSVLRALDFEADEIDGYRIRAALVSAVEDAGLELRGALLAARRIRVVIRYADGIRTDAETRSRPALVLDSELMAAADGAFAGAATRRVRLRGLALSLSDLEPARREPDLFAPDGSGRLERLQAAVDASRTRWGPAAVTRACALGRPVACAPAAVHASGQPVERSEGRHASPGGAPR
jgi:DNA polymerase IV